MKIKHLPFRSSLALLLLAQRCFCQTASTANPFAQPNTNDAIFHSLTSSNFDARLNATVKLDTQRTETIQKLIAIADSTNSPDIKVFAVVVLGEYRAVEAVPVLLKNLDWDWSRGGIVLSGNEDWAVRLWPVSSALEKIGVPAVPALMDQIEGTDDAKMIGKCVSICEKIEGADVAQFRLQKALKTETDAQKRARLETALKAIGNGEAGK